MGQLSHSTESIVKIIAFHAFDSSIEGITLNCPGISHPKNHLLYYVIYGWEGSGLPVSTFHIPDTRNISFTLIRKASEK